MSFLSNLNWRHAAKKFDSSKPIADDGIEAVLEAIRLAPTSFGLQPFHVTVVTNAELKEKLKALAWGQDQITSCSHLLVFSSRTDLVPRAEAFLELVSGGNEEVKEKIKVYADMIRGSVASKTPDALREWAARQAYIALGFGLAACAELQIESCPMEGFDAAGYKTALGLAEHFDPQVVLAIGSRSPDAEIRPKVRFTKEDLFDIR